MRIDLAQSVGLVIDIQEKLFPHMDDADALLENTQRLLSGFEVLGVPVLLTEQYKKGLGATLEGVLDRLEDYRYQEKSSFSCCDVLRFVAICFQLFLNLQLIRDILRVKTWHCSLCLNCI